MQCNALFLLYERQMHRKPSHAYPLRRQHIAGLVLLMKDTLLCFSNLSSSHLLQADLAAKYVNIFQNYGLDLEAVQKLYEKHKHAPPVVRNAPPVAGNIMWARQLLRRIEMPMKRSVFQAAMRELSSTV